MFIPLLLLLCIPFIAAIPTWEGMYGRSMGSTVAGASIIEAMGPIAYDGHTRHLGPQETETPGNMTILPNVKNPPSFYIYQDQLFLHVNQTTVYPVTIHNSTGTHELPMQLMLGRKHEGFLHGKWKWMGSMLQYELPKSKETINVYYRCLTMSGHFNIFMTPTPGPRPPGCQIMTLHSFAREEKISYHN